MYHFLLSEDSYLHLFSYLSKPIQHLDKGGGGAAADSGRFVCKWVLKYVQK